MAPSLKRTVVAPQPQVMAAPRIKIPRAQRPNYIANHPKIGTPQAPAAAAPAAPSADTTNTLFPSTRMFEPQNYQGSPLYQFQVQEGQKQLGKSLAARGLTNSGYGITEEVNIPLRAAAQDTDRMTRVASENADRLQQMQAAEALRREREGNAQWDRNYSLASLLSNQNPFQSAYSGMDTAAGLGQNANTANANFLRDAYARVFGPAQIYTTPTLDNTGYDLGKLNADSSSNNELISLFSKIFQNFVPKEDYQKTTPG